ncbi:MAG TPA: ribosome small subunit-dependent GTPase A, partial [Thermoanaerobaculia bacterium]
CLNKVDLLRDEERAGLMSLIEPYTRLGVPLLFCSIKTREGLVELLELLRGKLCAFVGHSGVGKSSLLNALEPRAEARIGDVQERGGRGKHTTTLATMYDLGSGTRVIDTPGIREMGLWDVDRSELRFYFEEFEALARGCRFSDCSHLHEPGCAVKNAVEEGKISAERYDAYEKLVALQ